VTYIGDGPSKVAVARSAEQLNKILDDSRLLDGKKTTEQLASESKGASAVDPEDVNQNKIPLPAESFKQFAEITKDNEEEFDYVVGIFLIQFLESCKDKALEFPSCLDSIGRIRIHALADYLGIASHSQGQGKTRRIIVYPKHLFKQRQEKEAKQMEKERQKLIEKLKGANFPPIIPENPTSMRDIMMREVWNELQGLPIPKRDHAWGGPTEVRIEELKKKHEAFIARLAKEDQEYKAKIGIPLEKPAAAKEAAPTKEPS